MIAFPSPASRVLSRRRRRRPSVLDSVSRLRMHAIAVTSKKRIVAGVVRAIDKDTRSLYVSTHLTEVEMGPVNVLMRGNLELSACLLLPAAISLADGRRRQLRRPYFALDSTSSADGAVPEGDVVRRNRQGLKRRSAEA